MEKQFDSRWFIQSMGKELISEFQRAGGATHTHAVGGGRENSARRKLKTILPDGVGVGSGFVFDSYGNVSKQCDVILYEEAFALKFAFSEDYNNTYYNCESVIAVGEVKSDTRKEEFLDSLEKIKSVKALRRYNENGYLYRKYLTSQVISRILGEEQMPYNNDGDQLAQIFTFLLCQKLEVKIDTVRDLLKEKCDRRDDYPNKIISVDGTYLQFLKIDDNIRVLPGAIDATHICNIRDGQLAFNHFLKHLLDFIVSAETVPLNIRRYMAEGLTPQDLECILEL